MDDDFAPLTVTLGDRDCALIFRADTRIELHTMELDPDDERKPNEVLALCLAHALLEPGFSAKIVERHMPKETKEIPQ